MCVGRLLLQLHTAHTLLQPGFKPVTLHNTQPTLDDACSTSLALGAHVTHCAPYLRHITGASRCGSPDIRLYTWSSSSSVAATRRSNWRWKLIELMEALKCWGGGEVDGWGGWG